MVLVLPPGQAPGFSAGMCSALDRNPLVFQSKKCRSAAEGSVSSSEIRGCPGCHSCCQLAPFGAIVPFPPGPAGAVCLPWGSLWNTSCSASVP